MQNKILMPEWNEKLISCKHKYYYNNIHTHFVKLELQVQGEIQII